METEFKTIIEQCEAALDSANPQAKIEAILLAAAKEPAVVAAIAKRTKFQSLEDLALFRSDHLTLLAGALPAHFSVGPHNHNLWSVVSVCAGQEDNQFYKRDGEGLRQIGSKSIVAPGVLANGVDVIHAIRNPLESPLLMLHAYGGDLFATPRSNWDPVTHKEIPFDWEKVSSK